MKPILYPAHLYRECIKSFKNHIQKGLFKIRRKKRLAQFKTSDREGLDLAQINCGLTATCDHSSSTTLCVRASLSYEHFFQQQPLYKKNILVNKDHQVTLMAIGLRKYSNYAEYLHAIRKHSFFERKAKKAVQNGYYFENFHWENYCPDIRAIRESTKWRAFGLPPDPYVLTPEALKTEPNHFSEIQSPGCHSHWEKWFGIFQKKPGYCQGQIKTDQQLIAYARIRRAGNTAKYAEIIGHFEHLNNGVMAYLHLEIIKYLLNNQHSGPDKGIEYITYNNLERGADGLFFWKRKALFTPYEIAFSKPPLPRGFDPQST